MSDEKVMVKSAQDIIGKRAAGKAIEEIFNVIHPAPSKTALKELFTSESAGQFMKRVADFASLLQPKDDYEQALKKLDAQIAKLEGMRDEVLEKMFEQIRPIERSYRQLQLFFENAEVNDTQQRPPVDFFIFNADSSALKDPVNSSTLVAVDDFVKSRNDQFNFRQFICNLVVPGYIPDQVRKKLEEVANKWGMLLIGDLKDDRSFKQLSDQFRTDGGAYEFLKRPEDQAAADVVLAGHIKLRDRHWFESGDGDAEEADLYGPSSLLFAGCLARTDRTTGGGIAQGPVGMIYGKIKGVDKARVELRISEMEHLTMDRQVIGVIRNEDNQLCFVGSRTQAEDPNGVLKFFTSYRVLRYIERRVSVLLRRVAEQRLTRDLVKDQVIAPLDTFLIEEKAKGTIFDFDLTPDYDEDKFSQGILEINLQVLPVGPAETFNLKVDLLEVKKQMGV